MVAAPRVFGRRTARKGPITSVLRVVERVMGEGPLERNGMLLLTVGYQLTVYQEWRDKDGVLAGGPYQVDGYVIASAQQLERALGVDAPLTLHLDDGRRVQLYLVSTDGVITSADERGLYTA